MAMAAMARMIATTISNSISEKPLVFLIAALSPALGSTRLGPGTRRFCA
jgi:hypothetical protein